MWCVLLLLLWQSPVAPNQKTGSCSQPQPLCCLGTDNNCKRGSCYCDEFCHMVPDCCPDHSALCKPGYSHAGSFPPMAELDVIDASQTTKMVLQMVLRMDSPPSPARSNLDWVQSMVHQLFQTCLPGRPFSIAVKGIQKKA
uniref:SMB domain-containing protein n=1 Tax=Urocitellus parryii TaxID=9999 RepID=A0A8D2GPB0_UROPR